MISEADLWVWKEERKVVLEIGKVPAGRRGLILGGENGSFESGTRLAAIRNAVKSR